MKKTPIVYEPCRRGCGKLLATISRSHFGIPNEIKEKYHLICNDCMTRKEKNEMLEVMGTSILKKSFEG